jgi:hypothetical protein
MRLFKRIEKAVHDDRRPPRECIGWQGCPAGVVHYHWGYGQRQWSMTPVTGSYSFSDGWPYYREE